MARSAPSSAEKRNKVPTGRTVVRPVLRLERTGASSLCAQGRKQELEMIRGWRCPVSTGRGRPVCRPAVRPATGAHTGAPLPMVIGSGRKPDSPLSHGFAVPAPPEGEPLRAGEPRPYAMKWVRLETDGGLIHVIAGSEATRQSASPFCASHRVEKGERIPTAGLRPAVGMTEVQGPS